jgi:hypothetical protein
VQPLKKQTRSQLKQKDAGDELKQVIADIPYTENRFRNSRKIFPKEPKAS